MTLFTYISHLLLSIQPWVLHTGVENDAKGLRWSTNGDFTKVYEGKEHDT